MNVNANLVHVISLATALSDDLGRQMEEAFRRLAGEEKWADFVSLVLAGGLHSNDAIREATRRHLGQNVATEQAARQYGRALCEAARLLELDGEKMSGLFQLSMDAFADARPSALPAESGKATKPGLFGEPALPPSHFLQFGLCQALTDWMRSTTRALNALAFGLEEDAIAPMSVAEKLRDCSYAAFCLAWRTWAAAGSAYCEAHFIEQALPLLDDNVRYEIRLAVMNKLAQIFGVGPLEDYIGEIEQHLPELTQKLEHIASSDRLTNGHSGQALLAKYVLALIRSCNFET